MGRAWKLGDDISTDAIIPGRYLTSNKPKGLAKHALENEVPQFSEESEEGDVIVAGENFGCGSSREHAPLALIGSGIKAVLAKSFARIFYRNAINLGLLVMELEETGKIDDGDELQIKKNKVINKTKNEKYVTKKHPRFIDEIVEKNGLLEYIKEKKNV